MTPERSLLVRVEGEARVGAGETYRWWSGTRGAPEWDALGPVPRWVLVTEAPPGSEVVYVRTRPGDWLPSYLGFEPGWRAEHHLSRRSSTWKDLLSLEQTWPWTAPVLRFVGTWMTNGHGFPILVYGVEPVEAEGGRGRGPFLDVLVQLEPAMQVSLSCHREVYARRKDGPGGPRAVATLDFTLWPPPWSRSAGDVQPQELTTGPVPVATAILALLRRAGSGRFLGVDTSVRQ